MILGICERNAYMWLSNAFEHDEMEIDSTEVIVNFAEFWFVDCIEQLEMYC